METKKLTPEIIELLNKPLPPEAVKQHPTKKFLSTIKAIYVVERLNECFGIGGWIINNEFVERDKAFIVVKSTLHIPEYGIIIPDIYGGNDNADLGDAYKGACTDALTKIGSYLGIGMDVFKGLNDHPESKDTKPEDNRPWMKEKTLNQAIERIASGQPGKFATMDEFVAEINKTYRISKAYQDKINEALNFIKV
jgi:hypothetical protein